jgi:hypothetical protein
MRQRSASLLRLGLLLLTCLAAPAAWAIPIPIALDVTPDVLGTEWFEVRSGGLFPTYSLEPLVPHEVTVTLSDGQVDVFRMVLTQSNPLPLEFTDASFIGAPGAMGTLLALTDNSLLVVGVIPGPVTLLDLTSLEVYDPGFYRYTLGDDVYILPKGYRAGTSAVVEPPAGGLLGLALIGLVVLQRSQA